MTKKLLWSVYVGWNWDCSGWSGPRRRHQSSEQWIGARSSSYATNCIHFCANNRPQMCLFLFLSKQYFIFFCNFSPSVVLFLAVSPLHNVTVGKFGANCGIGCKLPILDNLTHGRMLVPSVWPARQRSNISAMVSWRTMCKQQCRVPARQTRSEFVCWIGVSILVREERWAANIRTDARAGGYGVRMGTDHTGQTTDSLWKRFVPYPEGSWAHEGGRKGGGAWRLWRDYTNSWALDSLTHTHTQTLWAHKSSAWW